MSHTDICHIFRCCLTTVRLVHTPHSPELCSTWNTNGKLRRLRFVELTDMLPGHHILPRFRTKPEGHVSMAPRRLRSRNDSKDVKSSRESQEPLTQITEG